MALLDERTGDGRITETPADRLARLLDSGTATVAVLGLGYVGLPLALTAAERGFPVLGFDNDPAKVGALNAGRPYLRHVAEGRLRSLLDAHRFAAAGDFTRLGEADVIAICVPTPLTPQREPDLRYVAATAETIAAHLRAGQLVVLESTTYPGTTAELVLPILAGSGLACGRDFFLAYSPEREDPGNREYSGGTIPKVVGADDDASAALAEAFYRRVTPAVVRVSSTRTAEATKLLENIFRGVNIALVNELKMIYERMGIDVWEVLDAAATKPFGFMRFDPGPGWGGHCIPVDPFYLAWKAREHGVAARFIELAGEVNVRMPEYVVERLARALNERGKPVKGSRVLLLGMAYKRDVDDVRESPGFVILDLLTRLGAAVEYHDPLVPATPSMRHFPAYAGMRSLPLDAAMLAAQDAVVVVTNHSGVDYELVRRHAPLIVDTRGVYRGGDAHVVPA
ncbi:MAG TPA: nucleotide sugar dehydrogenase [Thermoanaerobaculia bacterium]|nr:nucleotide sugar dehydrogenase [Thermoanaerobaculia bacterium]